MRLVKNGYGFKNLTYLKIKITVFMIINLILSIFLLKFKIFKCTY